MRPPFVPCPWCGSTTLDIRSESNGRDGFLMAATCLICGGTGPTIKAPHLIDARSERKAWKAWADRSEVAYVR